MYTYSTKLPCSTIILLGQQNFHGTTLFDRTGTTLRTGQIIRTTLLSGQHNLIEQDNIIRTIYYYYYLIDIYI